MLTEFFIATVLNLSSYFQLYFSVLVFLLLPKENGEMKKKIEAGKVSKKMNLGRTVDNIDANKLSVSANVFSHYNHCLQREGVNLAGFRLLSIYNPSLVSLLCV